MAKKLKDQPAQRGVTAELSDGTVIIKDGSGQAITVPLTQASQAKEEQLEALEKHIFIELLRVFKLGIDDLNKASRILNLDPEDVRKRYGLSLKTYRDNFLDDLEKRFQECGDYVLSSKTSFPPGTDFIMLDHLRQRGQQPEFKQIPSLYKIRVEVGINGIEKTAKKFWLDEGDLERWMKGHQGLLDRL